MKLHIGKNWSPSERLSVVGQIALSTPFDQRFGEVAQALAALASFPAEQLELNREQFSRWIEP